MENIEIKLVNEVAVFRFTQEPEDWDHMVLRDTVVDWLRKNQCRAAVIDLTGVLTLPTQCMGMIRQIAMFVKDTEKELRFVVTSGHLLKKMRLLYEKRHYLTLKAYETVAEATQ